MSSKMNIAILLLVIGVCNGSPQLILDEVIHSVGGMEEGLEEKAEGLGENSTVFVEDGSTIIEDHGKHLEGEIEDREEENASLDDWFTILHKKSLERQAYWNNVDSELEKKFNITHLGGFNFTLDFSDGDQDLISQTDNSRTHEIKKNLANGDYYYRLIKDELIDGVIHHTVINYNPQTKQNETTEYTKNTNVPNAEFVKV